MAAKKKAAPKPATAKKPGRSGDPAAPRPRTEHSAAYEAVLLDYAAALDLVRRKEFAAALEKLRGVEKASGEEPELAERSRTYIRLCERHLAPPSPHPQSAEGWYLLGVVKANEGKIEEALAHLDAAMQQEPGSARILYARSAARALQGNTAAAVADLRQAIALDPKMRYQASNDSDFEKIRDEAAFIDVIEPTPAGA
jgi:tetratricopeptide (TPR) repeat protein